MTTRVIHRAGPVGPDKIQRCMLCYSVLKDFRVRGTDFPADAAGPMPVAHVIGTPYPEGALIESGGTYQAMTLTASEPTCDPAASPAHCENLKIGQMPSARFGL